MKKIYTFLATAMMAITATTMFTSCDDRYWDDWEDRDEAYTLEGTWTGYIETYYTDRWGLTGDNYRTTLYFERSTSYGGWGYEVDYDMYSRRDNYYYCEFRWDVVNGNIRIQYDDSWNTVYIYDYDLYSNHFRGYMDDGTSRDIYFDLTYDRSFDWGYWRTRGTTRSQAPAADGSTNGDTAKGSSAKASGVFARQLNAQ